MSDQYTVRVVRHSGINGQLRLATTLSDPDEVSDLVRCLLKGLGPMPTEPGDVITINLMGDFEKWKRGELDEHRNDG